MIWLILLSWYTFGLFVVRGCQGCWPTGEVMILAPIWPVVLVLAIWYS